MRSKDITTNGLVDIRYVDYSSLLIWISFKPLSSFHFMQGVFTRTTVECLPPVQVREIAWLSMLDQHFMIPIVYRTYARKDAVCSMLPETCDG